MLPSLHAGRHRLPIAIAIGVLVSVVAVLVLVQLIDASAVWLVLKDVNSLVVGAAVISLGVSMIVRTARWRAILPTGDAESPAIAALLPFVIIGYAANAIAPLRAGDVARGIITARRFSLGVPEVLGSIGLERLLDGFALAALLLAASIGVVVPGWFSQASIIVAVGAVAILAVLILIGQIRHSRIRQEQGVGPRVWRGVRSDNGRIGRSLGWSLMAWCLDGVTFWLCAVALGFTISPVFALLIAGGAALGSVAPSAPAALGTFELAGTAVAVALGMEPSGAFALVVLAHAVTVVPILAAAAFVAASAGVSFAAMYRIGRLADEVSGRAVSSGSVS
jgi:uncharacterized membrane protein YbhN (UPF0104 family)